ncbi:hypothetical protein F5J12DRAFT_779772 [Pisolithus orientalis]|uniref:uncharacterized protein n=1 Tax=Pisolithus orientalis TaxID=936130 RepID=UPI002224A00F|nr:uncharacterized protein F5J12DRAFT_779772 [Pisolithus orientalis]KAI6030677.1 hypothetical protein F5J12DRAFT_779772 [Pisolithus orientalis]
MATTGSDVDSSDVFGKHTDECYGLPTPGKWALENPEPPPEAKLRDIKLGHWRSSGQPLYSGDKGDLSMDVDVADDRECDARKWDTSPMSQGNIPHTSLGKFHGWTLWLPPIKTFAEFHQCIVWSCTRADTCARNSSCKFHEWTLQLLTAVSFAEFHLWKVQSHTRANTCARNSSHKLHEWTLQSSTTIALAEFHSWNSSCKFHEWTLQSLAAISLAEFHLWKVQSHIRANTCARNSSCKFHEQTLQSLATISLTEFHSWKVQSHTRANTCARNSSHKFHEHTL